MDNETRQAIKMLESANEVKAEQLSIANAIIVGLEQQIADFSGPDGGSVDASSETQVDFIRRVAESRTKFSQEAKDIIAIIDANV